MKLFFSLFFLLLTSCGFEHGMGKDDKEVWRMVKEFAQLQSSKGMHLVGIGQGENHDTGKHNYIEIILSKEKVENIAEARKLLVLTIIDFLDFINSKENVQPYIDVHPFTLENVRVAILISDSKPSELDRISNFRKELCYYENTENPYVSVEVLDEPFEKAVEILQKEGALPQNLDGHKYVLSNHME